MRATVVALCVVALALTVIGWTETERGVGPSSRERPTRGVGTQPRSVSAQSEDARYQRAAVKYRRLYKRVERSLAREIHKNRRLERRLASYQRRDAIPHRTEWLCIHGHEGAWDDPDPPYWGGLQMDREFMQTYGAELLRTKGTADNWTPFEQMLVAERAYLTRGFWPWPNTARRCGLL